MVARGEIGLLIVQIGYNDTPYVSAAGFYTAVWAILLNTIIGPVVVGLIIKHKAQAIADSSWGIPDRSDSEMESTVEKDDGGQVEGVLEEGDVR